MGLLSAIGSFFITDDSAKTSAARAKRESDEEQTKRTILVIDDDSTFLDVTVAVLRDAGYNVLKSSSGPKGLNVLRYAPQDVHVVLLDYDMPQLNGAETLQFVRRLAPGAKVIGVTGVDPKFLPGEYREGLDELLRKPFDNQAMLTLLSDCFETADTAVAASA